MINFCTKINVPKCRENISITKMSLPFDECNDDLPSTFPCGLHCFSIWKVVRPSTV